MRGIKEWLTGFKSLGDVPNINATKFEIQTNKDTYKVVWEYEIRTNTDEGIEYRQYKNDLRSFCKASNILTLDYGFNNYFVKKLKVGEQWETIQ